MKADMRRRRASHPGEVLLEDVIKPLPLVRTGAGPAAGALMP